MFNKNKLSWAIMGALASSSLALPAMAQGEPMLEEVLVTGIRASLDRAMDIKRDSAGVVDAISAEDIGKFPDTNLAESLQRITGVSISRNNGEGAEVTVRGFGAGNNMVTLNGRTMPTAQTSNGGGGGSRAFDFGNLSSDAVTGVEVYKTGKASITTGGIGATINLLTAKPLDNPGLNASFGAKAVHDTTNRFGDDVTPEVSGLVSWANDTFGAALSVSHSQRDSAQTGAFVNGWMISEWDSLAPADELWNGDGVTVVNPPEHGQLFGRFEDIRYQFTDTQRTRNNAQLTLQYAPTDDFTATVDYTFAENESETHLGQSGQWMQQGGNLQEVHFDDQAVATPIYVRETYANGIDEGFEQQWNEHTHTLESFGINLEYQVNDALSFALDVHDSEMHSRGTGPSDATGRATGQVRLALASPTVTEREWFFGGDLPTYQNVYDNTIPGRNASGEGPAGTQNYLDVGSTMLNLSNADQKSTVTQIKLDGSYEYENGRFDFGVEAREMESHTVNHHAQDRALGGWDADHPGEFGELVQPFDLHGEFDDFSPNMNGAYSFRANAADMYQYTIDNLDRYSGIVPLEMPQTADNRVTEEMLAAYFQVEVNGDLGGMPFSVLTGLRYETTDVDSSSLSASYTTHWASNNDLTIQADGGDHSLVSADASYDSLLPSLDVRLDIRDDLVARFSVSKTIARAGLGDLGVSASGFGAGGGSTLLGAQPGASASNPSLLPLESTNFDLSLEWYYDDASYVSIGAFEKNVFNFIGSEQVNRTLLDIRNPTEGPRAQRAAQQLVDNGFSMNDDNLFGQMVFNEFVNPNDDGNYDADWVAEFGNVGYGGTEAQNFFLQNSGTNPNDTWNIVSNDSDPLTVFRTATPNNGREAKIHGMEFAVQHFFGDTGFGVQANYTIVRGDVAFDDLGDPNENQFYLSGLSDTANLVGMYETDRFQARLAYNWRDKYISGNGRGSINPMYVEAYSQIDVNLSYEVIDNLTLSLEGINITGENSRSHGRNYNMLYDLWDLGARYQIGARYTF